MGYPAFVMPRAPLSEQQIASDPELAAQAAADPNRKKALLEGHPGESWWHKLPENLKQELLDYIETYERPAYDGTLESFDGPCIWLDTETRLCKNHLHRPNVCRDFETGCSDCLDWRKTYRDRIK
jgi:Fe-S-cluster containining protein